MKTKVIYAALSVTVIAAALTLYYYTFLHDAERTEPPLALQIPYDTLSFRAEDGFAHHYFTGSNISVPKDAFVDAEGSPVRGEVKMFYREFHAPEEILLSGIPMGNMEDASNRALQSAGMFEMNVRKGDEVLRLAAGKQINMQLAAFRPSDDYKIFLLNENFQWVEKTTPALLENTLKSAACAALPELPDQPANPGISADDIVIDIDADYQDYPHMLPFKKYRWKLIAHPQNENFKEWMTRLNWERVKIEQVDKENNLFRLTFNSHMQDYKNQVVKNTCALVVTPVLTGDDYEKALAEFQASMNEYNTVLEQIEKEEERLAREADVLNAFSINQMGVWNCDRYVNNAQFVKIKATFDFEDEINPYVNKVKVYVINHTDNTVQDYGVRQWNSIYFRSGSATSLMAVLPDNRIAIYPQEEFVQVDFNAVSRSMRPYHFTTQSHSALLENQEKLKGLL